jgi:hypothetical protein
MVLCGARDPRASHSRQGDRAGIVRAGPRGGGPPPHKASPAIAPGNSVQGTGREQICRRLGLQQVRGPVLREGRALMFCSQFVWAARPDCPGPATASAGMDAWPFTRMAKHPAVRLARPR